MPQAWASDMSWGDDTHWPEPMPWPSAQTTASQALARTLGPSARALPVVTRNGREVTGEDVVALARKHVGEDYVLGARVPLGNANWTGPWDCAEFASWCVFHASGILFGTEPRNDPVRADAYTGYWAQQARAARCTIAVADAAVIPGALVLRYPSAGVTGHIVISDGKGGTVEAHSSKDGVTELKIAGRRWDVGVLVPGIRYYRSGEPVALAPPAAVIRLMSPMIKSPQVEAIQKKLAKLGYTPGGVDGVYGPQTADAVSRFQADQNLVPDGEVGEKTMKALGL
jgi:N-acetylmuramoyl-L-alanine amidase